MNELKILGEYLAGEFENREQSLAQPTWYVNLRLWLRPVTIFDDDSIALFAEQANIIKINQPYRQRIWRLKSEENNLIVEHYKIKDRTNIIGGGSKREILENLTLDNVEYLPTCNLKVKTEKCSNSYHFQALPISDIPCSFSYENQEYLVKLGFEINERELLTFDKGIDKETGKAIWGALMGPYIYQKITDFSSEINS